MSEQVDATQRQIQEQKVRVHSQGHWIGEAIKWGAFLILVVLAIAVFLWVFGGDNGKYTVLASGFLVSIVFGFFLYHLGRQTSLKTKRMKLDSHFHDVSPILTIGDVHTREFTPFYVPQVPELEQVKDEPVDISPYSSTITTLEQQREKRIQDYYEEGKTMKEIVDIMQHSSVFEAPSMYDVRKALGKTGKENQE